MLRRDNWVCRIVPRCHERATVADHIIPVFPGMPDSLFFAMDNLRAGCRVHNSARGFEERLKRDGAVSDQPTDVVTEDYS